MSKITCTRKIAFDAAHRVMEHESKCKMLHGHRYTIEARFEADKLDSLGRVVDFGYITKMLGTWVDDNWDHNIILNQDDAELGEKVRSVTSQNIFYLSNNPTAENMASYILDEICPTLFIDKGFRCVRIRLWETPNCYADAVL